MNFIRVIDKNGKILDDEIYTTFHYKIGDIVYTHENISCKCKEVVNGLENTIYVFVEGWTEYGF